VVLGAHDICWILVPMDPSHYLHFRITRNCHPCPRSFLMALCLMMFDWGMGMALSRHTCNLPRFFLEHNIHHVCGSPPFRRLCCQLGHLGK
jgi:hypothetical protein